MDKADFLKRVRFILRFGKALHSVGSPAHTLEGTLKALCSRLGIKGSIVSIPTAIFSSFQYGEDEVSRIERVEPSGINLGRLTVINEIVLDVIHGRASLTEGELALDRTLEKSNSYSKLLTLVCFMITSCGMLTLFGGSYGDMLASLIVGFFIGLISLIKPDENISQIYEIIIAIFATFASYLLARFSEDINVAVVIISSMIIFMPGLNMTIAIAEVTTNNLASGSSRLVGGAMVLLKLAFGVFIGKKLSQFIIIRGPVYSFDELPHWILYLSVPITSFMSVIIFKARLKDWLPITCAGIIGYVSAKLGTKILGPELGLFFGGVVVGSSSNLFARITNKPSSLFQFPGMILLVPGSIGYKSLRLFFEKNMMLGFNTAFSMLILAFSLVVGVFVGNILLRPRRLF
jgi:uncharacterized membrane protein YjjP (DUF1212 family)